MVVISKGGKNPQGTTIKKRNKNLETEKNNKNGRKTNYKKRLHSHLKFVTRYQFQRHLKEHIT